MIIFTATLKLFIEVKFMIFGGKLFQSLIVLGQKLYSSHDVRPE